MSYSSIYCSINMSLSYQSETLKIKIAVQTKNAMVPIPYSDMSRNRGQPGTNHVSDVAQGSRAFRQKLED